MQQAHPQQSATEQSDHYPGRHSRMLPSGIQEKSLDGRSPLELCAERLHGADRWRRDTQFKGLSTNRLSPLFQRGGGGDFQGCAGSKSPWISLSKGGVGLMPFQRRSQANVSLMDNP